MPDTDKKPEPDKKKEKKKNKGRELVECLLVAAVLALTIRTVGFQIFKIPTRSMEPTLYGNEHYGDRVVAMMWYNRGGSFLPLRLGEIRRWQVIVFKHHDDQGRATNFIKRLAGLPNEVLEIRDGDVWIDGKIARKPRELQKRLWIKLGDLDFSESWRMSRYWRVWTKNGRVDDEKRIAELQAGGRLSLVAPPGESVLLRWISSRPIDNRFIRTTVRRLAPEETPCGHGFRAAFDTARPVVFCPKCHRAVYGVTDDGYAEVLEVAQTTAEDVSIGDFWSEEARSGGSGKGSQVGDLRLALDFEDLAGKGVLEVAITSRSQRFKFVLPLGEARPLARLVGPKIDESRRVPLAPGRKVHHLEVINVDGEFRAELDGVEVGPCQYVPTLVSGRYASDVEITVSNGARLAVDNLRLYRDLYYGHVAFGSMRTGTADGSNGGDKSCWVAVPDKSYFFLGDNSLASKDSRYFEDFKREEDIVARGLLVGWPPSRVHWIK